MPRSKRGEPCLEPGPARNLVDLFKLLRAARPLSNAEIARRSGYSPGFVSDVLRGWKRPSPDAAVKIVGVFEAGAATVMKGRRFAEQLAGRQLDAARPLLGAPVLIGDPAVAVQFGRVLSGDQRPDPELAGRRWQAALDDPLQVRDFTAETRALLEFFRSEAESAELRPWLAEARGGTEAGRALLARSLTAARQDLADVQRLLGKGITPDPPPALRAYLYDQIGLIAEHTRGFVGRASVTAEIKTVIATRDRAYCHVLAHPGVGKSALLASLVKDENYVHHFNMRTLGIVSPEAFLGNICVRLIGRYGLRHPALPPRAVQDGGYLTELLGEIAGREARKVVTVPAETAKAATAAAARAVAAAARLAVTEVADPEDQAGLLAEVAAVMDDQGEQEELFGQALRLAATLDVAERWRVLAAVGTAQVRAHAASAADTFDLARREIRESEDDPWFWRDELWQVGIAQAEAGDAAGARDTFAEALRDADDEPERWLKPLTLAGLAVALAQAGKTDAAHRACALAARHAAGIPGEQLATVYRALAVARPATGDLPGAAQIVSALLAAGQTAAEEDDDGALHETVEQGVRAGVRVARELARAEGPGRSREFLHLVAEMAREWLEDSFLGHADAIAELAEAQAEVGDLAGAAATAGWDETGTASDRMCGAAARFQADAGDLPAALVTARNIRDPRAWARALREVGQAMAEKGERAQAHADTGNRDAVAGTLTAARDSLTTVPRPDDRDELLSQIAQSWAAHGDAGDALRIAREIVNPGRAGEALFAAALATGASGQDCWQTATAITDTIESPWWHAAGLAAVAAVTTSRGYPDDRPYLADVQKYLNQIPPGEFRVRLEGVIIDLMLKGGHPDVAVQIARSAKVGLEQTLTELAADLAARGNASAIRQLLPDCARYAPAAFGACLALARVVPDQADIIMTEIDAAS